MPAKSSSDLTVSGKTVTVPAGIYDSQAQKSVADGSATPSATVSGDEIGDTSSSYPITITPKATVNAAGYISTISDGTAVTKYIQTESKSVSLAAPNKPLLQPLANYCTVLLAQLTSRATRQRRTSCRARRSTQQCHEKENRHVDRSRVVINERGIKHSVGGGSWHRI